MFKYIVDSIIYGGAFAGIYWSLEFFKILRKHIEEKKYLIDTVVESLELIPMRKQ